MKKVRGWWLPENEMHIVEQINTHSIKNRGNDYQTEQRDYSLALSRKYERRHDIAIDIGAHVGLWACDIAQKFKTVICFEPIEEYRECLYKNLKDRKLTNVYVNDVALGERGSQVTMKVEEDNSGATHIKTYDKDNGYKVQMRTLDSYGLKDVHYIKIDAEGYEFNILKGAEWTLETNKPIVVMENKDNQSERYETRFKFIRKWMYERNYIVDNVINSEVIWRHKDVPMRDFSVAKDKSMKYADSRSNDT